MAAAVAEFERNIIAQRTQAGIAALKARRKGKPWKWGRKLVMTPKLIALAGDHLNGRNGRKKLNGPQTAKKLGVSTASIYAHWKQAPGGRYIRKRPKAA